MDLAIKNTILVTMKNNHLNVIEDGAVGINFDKIEFIGKTHDLDENEYSKVLDRSNHVTMPGLIDSHIHSGLTLLRGAAQDVPEKEWMDKALGPITKHVKEKDRLLGSKLGVLEGLRSGTTTFSEFTSNLDEVIEEVYRPYGARVVGAKTINEVVDNGGDTYVLEKSEKALEESEKLFQKYNPSDMIEIMYGPQALDMVTMKTLRKIYDRALQHDRHIHMHVAQGGREKNQIKERYGSTTVKKLNEEDMLNENLLAAHCHATTQDEKRKMIDERVKMVGCPSSIATIDGIIPPIYDYLSMGGNACLGSDQAPGNGAHNMFREMRTISILTKCRDKDPTLMKPWETLNIATRNGARALGLEDKIGTLEEGKKADIITVDLKNLNLGPVFNEPFTNVIPNLVYSSTGLEVNDVIINGKKIIIDERFVDLDKEEIRKEVNGRSKEILSESKKDWLSANSKMVDYHKEGYI